MAIDLNTYSNSRDTSIVIRYEIITRWNSRITEMREFSTKQAAQWFLQQHLPRDAQNLDVWITDNSPRQEPTFAGKREPRNRWWDENKRPFTDRYTEEDAH